MEAQEVTDDKKDVLHFLKTCLVSGVSGYKSGKMLQKTENPTLKP